MAADWDGPALLLGLLVDGICPVYGSPVRPTSLLYHIIALTVIHVPPRRLPYYTNGHSGPPVNDRSSGPYAPDLELVWVPQTVFADGFQKPSPGTAAVTLAAVALKPESRGRITLRSNNAFDIPYIDPQYVPLRLSPPSFKTDKRRQVSVHRERHKRARAWRAAASQARAHRSGRIEARPEATRTQCVQPVVAGCG